ncbi:MAG: hypothetical protein R3B48_13340 [Kofleriaceae bacterium]
MSSPGLPRPEHLAPPPSTAGAALRARAAGLAALTLGAVGFIVVTVSQRSVWAQPDWRLTTPFFVASLAAAAVALARKEPSYALPLLGVGLAAAAMVLGWFLLVAAVVVATGLGILALSHIL